MTTLNGVVLNADRRGHENFSNVYWKRAPPALANTATLGNTTTSDFFIKIKTGFRFVITDMHNKSACLPGSGKELRVHSQGSCRTRLLAHD